MEPMTYTERGDGAIIIKDANAKDIPYVKESDLLAVKGASETARADYESKITQNLASLAESNRLHDETKQKLLQEQAAKEQLATKANEAATLKTKVGELETNLNAATAGRKQLEEELLGTKRSVLVTNYKVDPKKVEAMSLDQLRETEKALTLAGITAAGSPARFDHGPGGGTAITAVNPLDQARQEIDAVRRKKA